MPHPVEYDVVPDHIIAHAVWPDFEAVLADTLAFQLFRFGRWAEGIGLEERERGKHLGLDLLWETFEILPKGGGELNDKPSHHELGSPALQSLLEVVLKGDRLSGSVLLMGDLEGLLKVRIEFLEDVVVVLGAKNYRSWLAALRDHKARLPLGDLFQDRAQLCPGDIGRDGDGHRSLLRHGSISLLPN